MNIVALISNAGGPAASGSTRLSACARGDREAYAKQGLENYKLFGAPHVAIITSDEALGTYGAVDCGAYVNNFLLAAQSLGVASISQAALASHSKFVREHFGLGDDRLVDLRDLLRL